MILEILQLSNQHVLPSKMGPPVSSVPTKRAPSLSILLSVIDSSTALSSRRRGKAESKSSLDRVEIASTTNYGWSTTPPGNTNTFSHTHTPPYLGNSPMGQNPGLVVVVVTTPHLSYVGLLFNTSGRPSHLPSPCWTGPTRKVLRISVCGPRWEEKEEEEEQDPCNNRKVHYERYRGLGLLAKLWPFRPRPNDDDLECVRCVAMRFAVLLLEGLWQRRRVIPWRTLSLGRCLGQVRIWRKFIRYCQLAGQTQTRSAG